MKFSLKNKTVLITGASSGIGKAAAEQFAELGARIIITARRKERLAQLSDDLRKRYSVDVLDLALDVQDAKQAELLVKGLSGSWKEIDVLVNNAGLALTSDKFQDGKLENWDAMIQTNLCGLLYMTHAILPIMIARQSGHIINVSSTAGHDCYPGGNIYSATKHAVRSISKSLRLDLLGTSVRITDIAPGMVETEFSEVRLKDKNRAKQIYEGFSPLNAEDIADAIVYAATRPLHVDVAEMVIFPTAQASMHYIHKAGKSQGMFKL